MKTLLTCTVNGEERTTLADTRDTLLELLRERLGLTGTKEGCSNGNCGTCTVLMDGAPVNACLVLALEVPGRAITTIEGLSGGADLHPIQQALVDQGGTQCGFCTPGIVLASVAPTPIRAPSAEQELIGAKPTRALLEEAGRLAAGDARPISDTRGSADYRRSLVAVLTARALADCCRSLDDGMDLA